MLPWGDSELYLVHSLGQRLVFFVQEFLRQVGTFDKSANLA